MLVYSSKFLIDVDGISSSTGITTLILKVGLKSVSPVKTLEIVQYAQSMW